MIKIGEKMRKVRKKFKLTQKELGEALTVSASYISKVENGVEKPTAMFIKLFCLLYSIEDNFSDSER